MQDAKAEDEVIAEDMDLEGCIQMMMVDVLPKMGTMLGLVVAELIDGARAGSQ